MLTTAKQSEKSGPSIELPPVELNPLPENSLIDPTLFVLADPNLDPFAVDRPAEVNCDPESYGPLVWGLDVIYDLNTDACNYITVSQPSLETLSG